MLANNGLSDNARCYTSHSSPSKDREISIYNIFRDLCKDRSCPNATIFIALGDFPIVMKDRTNHPHCDRYIGTYENVYPKQMSKIFSRSKIENLHDDELFPTRDFIDVVYNIDKIIKL